MAIHTQVFPLHFTLHPTHASNLKVKLSGLMSHMKKNPHLNVSKCTLHETTEDTLLEIYQEVANRQKNSLGVKCLHKLN